MLHQVARSSWKTCTTPLRRVWTLLTSSPSPQVMSPRPMTSTSFWTRRRSSPTWPLLRTRTTTTLHSRRCSIGHIEHKSITLYEKTCLSVCRRRQCPIEQGNLLERDRGDSVSTEAQKRRLGLYSMIKKSTFLQNAKQELVNTNSNLTSIHNKERNFRTMYFKFRTSQEFRGEILARTLDIPRPGTKRSGTELSGTHVEGKWDSIAAQMVERFKETGHQYSRASESWNSEKKEWQIPTLQCGFIEHRTLISHDSLRKSAQYLRSSRKLVWRVRSKDYESKRVDFGKVRGKRKWAATVKIAAARKLQGVIIQHLETDCENVSRDLKHWRFPIYKSVWR